MLKASRQVLGSIRSISLSCNGFGAKPLSLSSTTCSIPLACSTFKISTCNKNNNHHVGTKRYQSTSPLSAGYDDNEDDSLGPVGDLFTFPSVNESIIGKTGSIRRSFGPQSNAQAMIICGGEPLAANATFDPNYNRAQHWIRSHPVGPAILSGPVLISGFVGSLIEAAFPKSIALNSNMSFMHPLIVGVEVRAKIEVIDVCQTTGDYHGGGINTCNNRNDDDNNDLNSNTQQQAHNDGGGRQRRNGHQVNLKTGVFRVNDEVLIAKGTHSIWIPDYSNM